MIRATLLAVAIAAGATAAGAATLTHSANDFSGTLTPPAGGLTDAVGTFYTPQGVDYTYGNTEGVFSDTDANGICGINAAGACDLVTTADGRIVVANTLVQGLTNYIYAEAGIAAQGSLLLSVFDKFNNLIASVANGLPLGPNLRTTFEIDRGSVFDIAYFSISGQDSWGLNAVTIGEPIRAAVVPLPATLPLIAGAFAALGALARRRRSS